MGNFGDRLKREREMRGISLEEISASTKISTRSLQALEAGDFDKLPGGIFNKGFVRSYARFLGLDEEDLVSDYSSAEAAKQQQRAEKIQAISAASAPESRAAKSPLWLPFAVVVALVIVGLALWKFWLLHQNTGAPAQPVSGAQVDSSKQDVSGDSTPGNPSAGLSSARGEVSSTEVSSTEVPSAHLSSAQDATGRMDAVVVDIVATQDSWISVTADGKLVIETVLGAGEKKSVRGKDRVRVKLGNAGGVKISFNGKELPPFGEEKQTKTLTFTPSGVQ